MSTIHVTQRLWTLVALAIISMMVVSACGDTASGSGGLPTLAPTITALAPATPTDIPAPDPVDIPAVNWDDVDRFQAAMRPGYENDIKRYMDRNRYYIEANLMFEEGAAVLLGAERVRYVNRTADTLDEIVFRLYPNMAAAGGRMIVYRTTLNDVPVEPTLAERETVLVIPLDHPLAPGESAEMTLQFSTAAEQGMFAGYGEFGLQDNVFSGPQWYPVLSVYEEGNGWWRQRPSTQGDPSYLETALFEVLLTVPEHFVTAMSGTDIGVTDNGDGTKTVHNITGPMRDFLLVASPGFGQITEYMDDIAVSVYFWPGDEDGAEYAMDVSLDAMRAYDTNIGAYPFAEFDVVETFNLTGIEYPGMTIIADRYWRRGDPFLETVLAHEIGHQWFYSLVGNDQVNHPWLDESLTCYTEYIYARAVHGEDEGREWVQNDRDRYNFYLSTGAADLVLNLPVSAYVNNNYGAIIYVKGPLFYVELERMLGRDTLMKAIQTYFDRFHYEVVTSRNVLETFEEVSEQELDAVFYQWVGEFDGLDPDVIADLQTRQ
ncbi:MAG: M1 family metallopeptidase [Anaerolineae bacterium]|nr:M1 family metallopeptidase [Anaerolineae bacterium]